MNNALPRLLAAARKRLRLLVLRLLHPGARFGRKSDIRARFCLRRITGARVYIGEACVLDNDMTIECGGLLRIGDQTIFGHHCTLAALESIVIGEDCLIAEMVSIRDHNHRFDQAGVVYRKQGMIVKPVKIGCNVWLGSKVTIAAGVSVGDNTVVGANSVVTRDLPANCLAAGAPARVIRNLLAAEPDGTENA